MEVKLQPNKIAKIKKTKRIGCPNCKKEKEIVEAYYPFCSKRCSDNDLMKWLTDENDAASDVH